MRTLCVLAALVLLTGAAQPQQSAKDISGTWVAKVQRPFGEVETVYELKVTNGKVTGTQKLPFGDSPIVDGKIEGDQFELAVDVESFGDVQRQTIKGTIVGDELHLTPAVSVRRPAAGPNANAPGAGGPPPAVGAPGPGGPGGPGGGGPAGFAVPIVARRGTPTPSYRAPSVDFKSLPTVELPALKELPANGLAMTPPMGWNSWNKFRTRIDDKTVREIADAMVSSSMKDAGYTYINIDDGWQWKRDAAGVLQANPNFPDMKALADYVHSKGLRIGIYSSPGPRTCGGFEGSYGHEDLDAKTWASWGMDYLKYDWCSASRIWKDEDMRAVYQRMGEALRRAGRPMVYSLCQYGRNNVQEWGPLVGGNSWRTTGDIRDAWQSMTTIGFSQGALAPFAKPGHWNDPDMLEVGNGAMSQTEYQTHFSLWALLASPLLAGNDLRTMTPETKAILLNKEVIAVDQDKLGKAATRVAVNGETEVWTRPLDGGAYAVGLFNRGAAEAEVSVKWTELAGPADAASAAAKPRAVRDLWAAADRGTAADGFTAKVAPHGVVMLRITPAR